MLSNGNSETQDQLLALTTYQLDASIAKSVVAGITVIQVSEIAVSLNSVWSNAIAGVR